MRKSTRTRDSYSARITGWFGRLLMSSKRGDDPRVQGSVTDPRSFFRRGEIRHSVRAGLAIAGASLLIFFAGCDNTPTEVNDYEPQPQLTAFIANGVAVGEIELKHVGGFTDYYDPIALGITGARIKMFPVLDADGTPSDTSGRVCYFADNPDHRGGYLPTGTYLPEGKVTYRIEAKKASDKVDLWAQTAVPDTFQLITYQNKQEVDANGDTLTREDPELYFEWTSSENCGGYQLGILAETEDRSQLLPLDPAYDPNNPDDVKAYEDVPRYGYTIAPYYQNGITLAWVYMTWAGPTRVDCAACSKEYFDYIFSQLTNPAANPLMNVHGGIGIFGATSRHSVEIYMKRIEG